MKNSIYGQMETAGNHHMGPETLIFFFFRVRKIDFLASRGVPEVPGGFKKLWGTGTNHLHLVSADFHGA